jgi:hypothetical protein
MTFTRTGAELIGNPTVLGFSWVTMCKSGGVEHTASPEPSPEETIKELRLEIARLKEELRRVRRDNAEVPPHYL